MNDACPFDMPSPFIKYVFVLFFVSGIFELATAQQKKPSLKDSLDGKFDVSDHVIEANGFIPVPYIITEPALGGFGVALFPIFIDKRPPYRDSVRGELKVTPVPPDVTGGGGIYTVNKTWGAFAFRSGTFVKSRIKYIAAGGYIHLNMSFYKTFEQIGEKELQFTINAAPVILQAVKRLGYSHWYGGVKYLLLKTAVSFNGDAALRPLIDSMVKENVISQLGIIVELDRRDNIFTPDKGVKIHVDCTRSDNAIGSDYDFWRVNYYAYWYRRITSNLIGGLRFDGKQSFGDAPFYMLPFIEMRGIPSARYQGNAAVVSELETRYDVRKRWSVMLFGGTGKAFDHWNAFSDEDWIFSYGTGFRYLIARKFKLRMGIDIAHGPHTWAYYIVFGSNWLK